MARLKDKYVAEIAPALQEKFGITNVMAIPKLDKVTINIGLGEAVDNPKALDGAVDDITRIAGQKPVVTLRGDRMYEFVDRLFNVALPRVRDFHGVSGKSFDGRGNYSLGLTEQLIFPEIDYDKIDKIRGMQIVFTTTAKSDEEGKELLKMLGMPFAG